jgi:arabinosaccharide transport system substrate-binding protein
MKPALGRFFGVLSPAAWVMVGLAAASSVGIALVRVTPKRGMQFWIFAAPHESVYRPVIMEWNRRHPDQEVQLTLVSGMALQQRMMSAFLSGTPIADLIEVERYTAGEAFAGPLDQVGFVDLTDRLKQQGLMERINPSSFSPWTSRDHIFGIPHDVHPVLLVYRADLVEAAGIDVSRIETWDDYFRIMAPLMKSLDGSGRIDRYLINGWPTDPYPAEMLLLQSGGTLFDDQERPAFNTAFNARFLAKLVTWYTGPHRVARSLDYFSASGHQMLLDGLTVGLLAPDWYAGKLKAEIPGLAGKLKVMPLPAWERGGRRTSVWGGTMLAIPKSSRRQKADWEFAQFLYLSPQVAEALYRDASIVSPVKANWSNPIYDQPDPYFCGQPLGRLYLNQAPNVPRRSSSPYVLQATVLFDDCLIDLVRYADQGGRYDPAALVPAAQGILDRAQANLQAQIGRNVFLAAPP